MSDISLDLDPNSSTYKDLKFTNGDLVLVSGRDEILQNLLQRLRVFQGEWFMDNTIGLPYYSTILVKSPKQSDIDAAFINAICTTPGVQQLNAYSFSADFTHRKLSISFNVLTTSGTVNYEGTL